MNLQALDMRELATPALRLSRPRIVALLPAALAVAGLVGALYTIPAWQLLCAALPVLGLLPECMR